MSQERTTKRLEHSVSCISLHCKRAFYKQEIYCYPIGWNVSIFEVALGFSFNCELTAPCFANCFLFRALRLFSFARVEDRNGMFLDRESWIGRRHQRLIAQFDSCSYLWDSWPYAKLPRFLCAELEQELFKLRLASWEVLTVVQWKKAKSLCVYLRNAFAF